MSGKTLRFRLLDIEAIEEDDAFAAWGYCVLKVQRGDETLGIRVRIISIPQELIDEMSKKAPRPPAKTVMLDPGSEDARRLGVQTRQKVIMPDYSDVTYQEAREAHDLAFRREVVGRGVASVLSLRAGGKAETPEDRYRALEERGLSGLHFTELAENILRLTQWTEDERESFLTPSSASAPGPGK